MRKRFPTVVDAGNFPLLLHTSVGDIYGDTVKEFFWNVMKVIETNDLLAKLTIPFPTSGQNNLIAYLPTHPNGKPFFNHIKYEFSNSNKSVFINTNHPRFFAIRQGARIAEAVGIVVLN